MENFLNNEDITSLKNAISAIIEGFDATEHRSVFTTTDAKQVTLSVLKGHSELDWTFLFSRVITISWRVGTRSAFSTRMERWMKTEDSPSIKADR